MTTPNAPASRAAQFQFLRAAHKGPEVWRALCLALARKAPGLPAIYPSARAAMEATPTARRFSLARARRGMVAYFSDPNDSNPFDHIVTIAGWDGCDACWDGSPDDDPAHQHTGDLNDLMVWSNDAKRTGGVDLVRGSFFPTHWGDPFRFAADWLNGYDLPGYDRDAKPAPGRETIGSNLDHAIADVRRMIRNHRAAAEKARKAGKVNKARGHRSIVKALSKDLGELRETRKRFPK